MGARTVMVIPKTGSVLWFYAFPKRHDALLLKILSEIIYEHKMEMRDAAIFHLTEFLPLDMILKAAKKSNCVFRVEAKLFTLKFIYRHEGYLIHPDS